jgi:hypothetical protein
LLASLARHEDPESDVREDLRSGEEHRKDEEDAGDRGRHAKPLREPSEHAGNETPPPRPNEPTPTDALLDGKLISHTSDIPTAQPYHHGVLGGVPERLNGAVSKTVVGLSVHRGFESLPLR